MNRRPASVPVVLALALALLLSGCRGCSASMEFKDLLGVWRMDVERALKETPSFKSMAPDTQASERLELERRAATVRFVYSPTSLKITMLLDEDATRKQRKDGTIVGRIKTLVEDRIVRHEPGKDGVLVLYLTGTDGKERQVHIRRLDRDHIEMFQPGSDAPGSFRFWQRVH